MDVLVSSQLYTVYVASYFPYTRGISGAIIIIVLLLILREILFTDTAAIYNSIVLNCYYVMQIIMNLSPEHPIIGI